MGKRFDDVERCESRFVLCHATAERPFRFQFAGIVNKQGTEGIYTTNRVQNLS
jgi:hypothetical protein